MPWVRDWMGGSPYPRDQTVAVAAWSPFIHAGASQVWTSASGHRGAPPNPILFPSGSWYVAMRTPSA